MEAQGNRSHSILNAVQIRHAVFRGAQMQAQSGLLRGHVGSFDCATMWRRMVIIIGHGHGPWGKVKEVEVYYNQKSYIGMDMDYRSMTRLDGRLPHQAPGDSMRQVNLSL